MKEVTSLPKFIERFLQTVCPEELYEEIEGDLIQRYNKNVIVYGQQVARRKVMVDTLRYVRPGIILRKKFSFEITGLDMIKHFIVTFSRSTRSFQYRILVYECLWFMSWTCMLYIHRALDI